jgi:dynein heavy chain
MEGVQTLRKQKTDWASAKKSLGEGDFIKQLKEFDKDNISENTRKKLGKFVSNPDFMPDVVAKVSGAGKSLCMWVRAMEVYARVFRVVGPKREALAEASAALASKQAALASAEAKLAEVIAKVDKLNADFQAKVKTKDELALKAAATKLKLERAKMLVDGLGGERVRWAATVKTLRANIILSVGDCLLAAGFLSYMGPFISEYRDNLLNKLWIPAVKTAEIPYTEGFDMSTFLANPTDVRFWNIQGLPSDQFSTENGVIVTRGRRWPLMIDPQGQAIKWIKNMERERGLKIVDLQMKDYLRTLENAIQYGTPVLMQNVGEELDPSLEPILNKAFVKIGGRLMLKLADKEVEFNPAFKFYITTKMSNPTYGPDISTKVTICNFAVVVKGLEAQMLAQVVRRERLDLEQQKDELVLKIAGGKKKLVELEDRILFLLANAKGSLLDDATLIDTLNTSKITSTDVNEQLTIAVTTEKEIDEAREGYRVAAIRASILFFVLNDIEVIDPMYQFALDAYKQLYDLSITKSLKSNVLATRIENINDYHTYAVYGMTCRGLFEKDKLLFSFHLNAKIFEAANTINMMEYNFFLRGGTVLDRTKQVPNPAPEWISEMAWDNITEMNDNLSKFAQLVTSFEQDHRAWHSWYTSACPETTDLPGEWQNSCNELQRMLLIRSLRQDRVAIVVTTFIRNNLGEKFTEPPPLDVAQVVGDSVPTQPLIFVLSTGVDPTKNLLDLADKKGMGDRMKSLSLGQGQAPIAEAMIELARKEGHWVFLANAHLSLSWMPRLAKIVETMETDAPHPDFRLWLSSSPTPSFPISILQAGIKMTTEPPKGIRANMKRLYASLTEEQFERCDSTVKYKKLLLGLAFFHSILIERRKFQMLGWNVAYPFNDSDFVICEALLSLYLEEYSNTPWDALKYLISGVMYGGHITDDWDRRLVLVYIADLFCEDALTDGYQLSSASEYFVQPHGDMTSYVDYLGALPAVDPPGAFGQHPNADISSMIREATDMLGTLVGLQVSRHFLLAQYSRIGTVLPSLSSCCVFWLHRSPVNVILRAPIHPHTPIILYAMPHRSLPFPILFAITNK